MVDQRAAIAVGGHGGLVGLVQDVKDARFVQVRYVGGDAQALHLADGLHAVGLEPLRAAAHGGIAQGVFVVPGDGRHAHAVGAVFRNGVQAGIKGLAALDGQHHGHLAVHGLAGIVHLLPALAFEQLQLLQHALHQGFHIALAAGAHIHGHGLQADAARAQVFHGHVQVLVAAHLHAVQGIAVAIANDHIVIPPFPDGRSFHSGCGTRPRPARAYRFRSRPAGYHRDRSAQSACGG